jgi:hypothetical protein
VETDILSQIKSLVAAVEAGQIPVAVALAQARQAIDAFEQTLRPDGADPEVLKALLGETFEVASPDDYPPLAGKVFVVIDVGPDECLTEVFEAEGVDVIGERSFPTEWFGTVLVLTEK